MKANAAAPSIIYTGETPASHINSAPAIGIQQLRHVILDDLAVEKTGIIISATTAGRIPLKIAIIYGSSYILTKNNAMARIIVNDGSTVPSVAARAP